MEKLPLIATSNVNDDKFDSIVIIANNLEKDLGNLLEHFGDLELIKKVIFILYSIQFIVY
jgi:hypothetical protein